MDKNIFDLKDVPKLSPDFFEMDLYQRYTGIYFYVSLKNNKIDTGYFTEYKPIGWSDEPSLCKHKGIVVLFENRHGDRTWFHVW